MKIICNYQSDKDLFAVLWPQSYTSGVHDRTFRQRVGDYLLLLREHKGWSRRQAAIAVEADTGTVKSMEIGGNAGWDFFERYATALSTSFEEVCRNVLEVPQSVQSTTPEERLIVAAYRRGSLTQRQILLSTAQAFVAVLPEGAGVPESSSSPTDDRPATANADHERRRKSRAGR